jgi:hypothetical protein
MCITDPSKIDYTRNRNITVDTGIYKGPCVIGTGYTLNRFAVIDCLYVGGANGDDYCNHSYFDFTLSATGKIEHIRSRFYGSGSQLAAYFSKCAAVATDPDIIYWKCEFFQMDPVWSRSMMHFYAASAYRHHALLYGCNILVPMQTGNAGSWGDAIFWFYASNEPTYFTGDIKRCCVYGWVNESYNLPTGTRTNNYVQYRSALAAGWTRRTDSQDHLIHFPIMASSSWVKAITDDGYTGYDFNGNATSGVNKTVGACNEIGIQDQLYSNGVGSGFPYVTATPLPIFMNHYRQLGMIGG